MGDLIVKQINESNPNPNRYYEEYMNNYEESWENNEYQIKYNFGFDKGAIYHVHLLLNIDQVDIQSIISNNIIQLKNNNNEVQFIQKTSLVLNEGCYELDFIFQPFIEGLNILSIKNDNLNNNIIDINQEVFKIYQITNLFENNNTIKKLGLLGEPNDSFCINGEVLHLPKNGVYEISDNDLEIKSFYKLGNFDSFSSTFTIKPFVLNYIEEINN